MKKDVDLLIINAKEIVTPEGNAPKKGKELSKIKIIENGGIAIKDKRVVDVGETERIRDLYRGEREMDLSFESIVLPSFIDSHTHLIFGGTREDEFLMRLSGVSYIEIQRRGGGIYSTVKATKEMSDDNLYRNSIYFIEKGESFGISTFEIKSGYGILLEDEVRILKIIERLKRGRGSIISTFLLHLPPKNTDRKEYLKDACSLLKLIKEENLSDFVDIFVDEGAFTTDEAYEFLSSAKRLGFKLSMHVDQFKNIGGIEVAKSLNVNSVSHLDKTDERSLEEIGEKDIVGIMFPTERFFLLKEGKLGRKIVDHKVPLVISTDFNPGTSPTINFYISFSLSIIREGLSIEEAINSSTINPAYALSIHKERGSIEIGKYADLQIINLKSYKLIPYFFGMNHLKYLIRNGEVKNAL